MENKPLRVSENPRPEPRESRKGQKQSTVRTEFCQVATFKKFTEKKREINDMEKDFPKQEEVQWREQ